MSRMREEADPLEFGSTRFGTLKVERSKVIRFVRVIPGFEGLRDFVLLDHDEGGLFKWLQSVEDPDIAFLLTYPRLFRPDYRVPMRDDYIEELGADSAGDLLVLVMVTASRLRGSVMLNLKAPVILNPGAMRAMQCIIESEGYECRFEVDLGAGGGARESTARGA